MIKRDKWQNSVFVASAVLASFLFPNSAPSLATYLGIMLLAIILFDDKERP